MMGVKTWTLCLLVGLFVSVYSLQMGISLFWTDRKSQKSCYGNGTDGVILFVFLCKFVVPSLKNTALLFLEILLIKYFTIFSCKQYDVITALICIKKNGNISKGKKDVSKRKTPFFCILKSPFK